MGEQAKEYIHPNRNRATKAMQNLINFVTIKGASGWGPADFIFAITAMAQDLVKTTNQALNDVERLQRQIDGLREDIGQLRAERNGATAVTVHILDPQPTERKSDAQ